MLGDEKIFRPISKLNFLFYPQILVQIQPLYATDS